MADQSDHQMEGVDENTGVADKGKGKAPQQAVQEATDDDSSDESGTEAEAEPEDDDTMEEIDTGNIVEGRRTRGKTIDFAKAAEELPEEDDDEEDDEDFEGDDAMEE